VNSVRYDAVNAMLLNEFLKDHRKNEQQEGKIQEQATSIATLKSTVAQQQKGMEAVMARLNEQAAQIQKVSAHLEARKPAPQVVNDP
jgi:pyruvate carboxylase